MKAVALSLLVALSARAGPDGGLDVELLDAGTTLTQQLVCMPPADAQTLDLGLRTAEHERDGLRTAVIAETVAGGALTLVLIAVAAALARK